MQTSTRTAPALSSKVACGSTSGAGARAGALVGARAHAAAALAALDLERSSPQWPEAQPMITFPVHTPLDRAAPRVRNASIDHPDYQKQNKVGRLAEEAARRAAGQAEKAAPSLLFERRIARRAGRTAARRAGAVAGAELAPGEQLGLDVLLVDPVLGGQVALEHVRVGPNRVDAPLASQCCGGGKGSASATSVSEAWSGAARAPVGTHRSGT